jgi:hypothetical protein
VKHLQVPGSCLAFCFFFRCYFYFHFVVNCTIPVRVDSTIMRVESTRKVFFYFHTCTHLPNQHENSPVSLKLIVRETLAFHQNTALKVCKGKKGQQFFYPLQDFGPDPPYSYATFKTPGLMNFPKNANHSTLLYEKFKRFNTQFNFRN